MPRPPYPAMKARALLEEWVALRVPKSSAEAPITEAAALAHLKARKVPTHRATYYKFALHEIVKAGALVQHESAGARRQREEWEAYECQLERLQRANDDLQRGNRELLGLVATMVFNARRLGISEEELKQPMPIPNRALPRSGRRRPGGFRG